MAAFSSTAGVTAPANRKMAGRRPALTMTTVSSGVRISAPVCPATYSTPAPASSAALSMAGATERGNGSRTNRENPAP